MRHLLLGFMLGAIVQLSCISVVAQEKAALLQSVEPVVQENRVYRPILPPETVVEHVIAGTLIGVAPGLAASLILIATGHFGGVADGGPYSAMMLSMKAVPVGAAIGAVTGFVVGLTNKD